MAPIHDEPQISTKGHMICRRLSGLDLHLLRKRDNIDQWNDLDEAN